MVVRMLTAVLVMAFMGTPALADFKILSWNFDGDKPGNPPAGFTAGKTNGEGGRWEVVADTKAISAPNVLSRIPSGLPSPAPQVIFIDGVESMNLDLTVRIKTASSGEGQGGGVVFRADDERNYYVVWLSPREKMVRIDKVVNGEATTLGDLNVESMEGDQWHSLRLTIRGSEMETLFDNRQIIAAHEGAWEFGRYKRGKVGLWARGTAATYFDNVRYTSMDGGTGSAPLGGTESTIITK